MTLSWKIETSLEKYFLFALLHTLYVGAWTGKTPLKDRIWGLKGSRPKSCQSRTLGPQLTNKIICTKYGPGKRFLFLMEKWSFISTFYILSICIDSIMVTNGYKIAKWDFSYSKSKRILKSAHSENMMTNQPKIECC